MPDNFQIILDADIKVASSVAKINFDSIFRFQKSLVRLKEKLELKLIKELNEDNQIKIFDELKKVDHDLNKIYQEYSIDLESGQKDVSAIQYDSEVRALNEVTKIKPEFGSFKVLPKSIIEEVTKQNRIIKYRDAKGKKKRLNIQREIKKLDGITLEGFEKAITDAVVQGKNSAEVGRLLSKNLDNVLSKSVAQVKSLTRTTMFDVMNRAKDVAEKDFKSVITGYMWVSVLDLRTTAICASLNGRVVKDKNNFPTGLPPIHFSCRSIVVPITKLSDIKEIERRFSISKGKVVNHRDDTRSTKFTPIKAQTGTKLFKNQTKASGRSIFDEWFDGLDPVYQKQWLGPKRFDIFKKHGLTTSELVTPSGKVLTIQQIRKNLNL